LPGRAGRPGGCRGGRRPERRCLNSGRSVGLLPLQLAGLGVEQQGPGRVGPFFPFGRVVVGNWAYTTPAGHDPGRGCGPRRTASSKQGFFRGGLPRLTLSRVRGACSRSGRGRGMRTVPTARTWQLRVKGRGEARTRRRDIGAAAVRFFVQTDGAWRDRGPPGGGGHVSAAGGSAAPPRGKERDVKAGGVLPPGQVAQSPQTISARTGPVPR